MSVRAVVGGSLGTGWQRSRWRFVVYVASPTVLLSSLVVLPMLSHAASPRPPWVREAPDVIRAQILAAQQNVSVEALSLRDETSRTLANPDGTLTTDIAEVPMHVRHGDSWTPVDTDLSVGADGRVHAGDLPFDVSLSNGGDAVAADVKPGRNKRAKFGLANSGNLGKPTISGSTATYPNVMPGIDAQLNVTPPGSR